MRLFKRKKTSKLLKNSNKPNEIKNKEKNKNDINKFKEQYFSYYDDIKDYTRGKEDWWYI